MYVAESQGTLNGVILLQRHIHGNVVLVSELSLSESCQKLCGILLIQLIRA